MTNYADSTYYTETYLAGKEAVIDTASFAFYARKATQIIKQHTLGNIVDTSLPDEVKMCCCEVAETIYKADPLNHNGISSEKVGEYSISYEKQSDVDDKLESDMKKIIYNWLAMTGLLYRGCS